MTKISLVQLSQMKNKPKKIKYQDDTYYLQPNGEYCHCLCMRNLLNDMPLKKINEPLIEIVEGVFFDKVHRIYLENLEQHFKNVADTLYNEYGIKIMKIERPFMLEFYLEDKFGKITKVVEK